jgi:hypothetical protein
MIQTGESLEFIINALIENKKVENSTKPIEDTYKDRNNKTPSRVTRRLSNNGFTGKSPLRNPILRQRTSPSPRHKKNLDESPMFKKQSNKKVENVKQLESFLNNQQKQKLESLIKEVKKRYE